MATIKQNQVALWIQVDGEGSAYQPFIVGEKSASATGISIPVVGLTPTYGRNRFGKAQVLSVVQNPPGDLPSMTITIYERKVLSFLETLIKKQCPINVWRVVVECGILDNPNIWDKKQVWTGGLLTAFNPGDAPDLQFSGEDVTAAGTLSFSEVVMIVKHGLSALTTTEANRLNFIGGIPDEDCNECGTGFPGADQLLIAGANAGSGVTANVLVSSNGGSSWAAASADPFAIDQHVTSGAIRQIENAKARYLVGTSTTDAGAPPKIAFADVTYGDELTVSWTTVSLASGANGEVVTALEWLAFDQVYIGAGAGDIYKSTDQGGTNPGAAVYTGAAVINGFAISPDGDTVYAFGASNLILREQNNSDLFSIRSGPSGGGAFTALAVDARGTILAGNGQSLYKNTNGAANSDWELLKNFGSNRVVKHIDVRGNGQVIRVTVDNTTPGSGELHESEDGGVNFRQVTAVPNQGYNDAYWSEINDNLGVIVGDVDGGVAVIHLAS